MPVATPAATHQPQSRKVVVVNHPLVAAKLGVLRARTTAPEIPAQPQRNFIAPRRRSGPELADPAP
jgi:hypothetical protein